MRHPLSLPSLAVFSLAITLAPACFAGLTAVNPSACPVGLSAEHHPGGEVIAAGRDVPVPKADGTNAQQSIDLSMKNTRLQRIVAAELQVHGTANKSRILRAEDASLTSDPTNDAVRNVHLVSSVPADQQRTRTIGVNLTSVAWISVMELRYADGSTWHARPGAECRVTPDPVMLIANK
jgi:hypothetical protein